MDISVVTEGMREQLHAFQLENSMLIAPARAVPYGALLTYWKELEKADTLKYRWSDMEKPEADSIVQFINGQTHYYNVVDVPTGVVVADFSLGPFTGKAAQVHFSMLPTNPTDLNFYLAEQVTNKILYQWKDITNLEESFIDTLFGLTPKRNRVACIFIQKVGFNKVGTLISGTRYLNEVDDALLTTKTRLN